MSMERQVEAGRWMVVLDTSGLAAGCHRVGFAVDGQVLGAFTLRIAVPPASSPGATRRGSQPS
jgi:hypothetical protein